MSALGDMLQMVLMGGRVARFHTRPTLKSESVAEHSYLVAWLVTMITVTPSANLLLACLAHDLPEYVLGDMPSPAKKRLGVRDAFRREEANLFAEASMPDYEALLTPKETEVLAFCDNFAGYLKCVYERQMGNALLKGAEANYRAYLYGIMEKAQHLDWAACNNLMKLDMEGVNHD
jgi:5'-deoxynucleotidase YfbR-like HD superfamily hydrolase